MAYIKGGQHQFKNEDDCPFCVAPEREDEESLIVYRGRTSYVVLNLFPYNPGHLLVCPYRHIPDYTDLTVEETAEFAELTQTAMRVLRKVANPAGFNLGMNQGVTAGPASPGTCTSTLCRAGAGTETSSRSSPRPRRSRRPSTRSASRSRNWPQATPGTGETDAE